MYVSEICAEGNFVSFPWWLNNVKSRSKIALFSNERHFEIWFPKKENNYVFSEVNISKLHKTYPILHVATTFSLKQGETRTSHGPFPHPLRRLISGHYGAGGEVAERSKALYIWISAVGNFRLRCVGSSLHWSGIFMQLDLDLPTKSAIYMCWLINWFINMVFFLHSSPHASFRPCKTEVDM